MKLGIIGFGRLGALLTRYLAQDFHTVVYEPRPEAQEAIAACGATAVDFATAAGQDLVLPLVPISQFEEVLQKMVPHLKQGAIVADCCSVKVKPVAAMEQHLPEHVSILATHPMFGPDSAGDTLFGSKLVICPVRIAPERYQSLKVYLEKHGIKLIESTPEEHDEQISRSLFLAHFIGRGLLEIEASPLEIDTKGYRRLMKILLTVENDSWQLFEDMYQHNPYAENTRAEFVNAMQTLSDRIRPQEKNTSHESHKS